MKRTAILFLFALAQTASVSASAQAEFRGIKHISGDLYMESIDLPEFQHLGMYDQWLKNNIRGMWRHIYER